MTGLADDDWSSASRYLECYRLKVVQLTPLSAFHAQVNTDRRSFEARFAALTSAYWRMWVGDYVARHRVRNIQRFVKNLYGERVMPVAGERVFYLTDAFGGKALTVTPDDVHRGALWLADLHHALDGAGVDAAQTPQPPMAGQLKPRYGSWLRALEAGRRQLAQVPSQVQRKYGLDSAGQDWAERWCRLADAAIRQLDEGDYQVAAQAAARRGEVAWNGVRLHCLRRTYGDALAALQTSDPVLDNSVYDLATLCQEVCEAGQADGVEDALETYDKVRPLTTAQRRSVVAYAAYPHVALATVRELQQMPEPIADIQREDLLERAEQQYRAARRLLKL